MSWADDEGYYWDEDMEEELDGRFTTLVNGEKICANCGSKNIKVSSKDNEYCADLCWVENPDQKLINESEV